MVRADEPPQVPLAEATLAVLSPSRLRLLDDVEVVVEQIPPRRILTYGDIAGIIGYGGPRGVGWAMSHIGAELPWWRVVRADGTVPKPLRREAVQRYCEENMPLVAGSDRVNMKVAHMTVAEQIRIQSAMINSSQP